MKAAPPRPVAPCYRSSVTCGAPSGRLGQQHPIRARAPPQRRPRQRIAQANVDRWSCPATRPDGRAVHPRPSDVLDNLLFLVSYARLTPTRPAPAATSRHRLRDPTPIEPRAPCQDNRGKPRTRPAGMTLMTTQSRTYTFVVLLALTVAAVLALPSLATAGSRNKDKVYFYTVVTSSPVQKQGVVEVNGIQWLCSGYQCKAIRTGHAARAPGIGLCSKLAREIGTIVQFGYPDRKLRPDQIEACNRYAFGPRQ